MECWCFSKSKQWYFIEFSISLGRTWTLKIYSHHTEKYIVEDSFNKYIEKYSKYIKIIQNFVEEQNRKTFE